MKKIILCLFVILQSVIVNGSGIGKPQKIKLKVTHYCDAGFGFCTMYILGNSIDELVNAEIQFMQGFMVSTFYKIQLPVEIMEEFQRQDVFPLGSDYALTDEIADALDVPEGVILRRGNYNIQKEAELYRVVISTNQ